jgi:tetratricopeptide (TPR) repeat protein
MHSAVDFNLHIPANALLIAFVFGILANPGTRPDTDIVRAHVNLAPRLAVVALGAILLFQCVRLLPGEYYADRARVALENEDPLSAVALANKALIYEQKNPNIFFYLGRALGALGNEKRRSEKRASYYDAALAAYDKARLLAPLDGNYPLDMAFAYDQLGRFAEAEWMYDLARSRDPRSVMMLHLYQAHLEAWAREGRETIAEKPDPDSPRD